MTVPFFCFAALLCGGCFFSQEPYKPVSYFDIADPASICPPDTSVNVRLFKMEASGKFKMQYRRDQYNIMLDDYNKWTLSPSMMLSRYLTMAFSDPKDSAGSADRRYVVDGSLYAFEIDLDKQETVIGLRYTIGAYPTPDRPLVERSLTFNEPFKEAAPAAFAASFTRNLAKVAESVRADMIRLSAAAKTSPAPAPAAK